MLTLKGKQPFYLSSFSIKALRVRSYTFFVIDRFIAVATFVTAIAFFYLCFRVTNVVTSS